MTRKPVDPNAPATLSPQQRAALRLFAQGNSQAEIAEIMMIGKPTVKEHLLRAYRSLHAKGGIHAVYLAYEQGFFVPLWAEQNPIEPHAVRIKRMESLFGELAADADQLETELEQSQAHLQQANQEIEMLKAENERLAGTLGAALAGLAGRKTVSSDTVAAVKAVAFDLSIMGGMIGPDQRSYGVAIRQLAGRLSRALRQMGEESTESPLDGMERALEAAGIHGVSREFLGTVLDGHPEIAQASERWDWADETLRDLVVKHVTQDMLGLTEQQYKNTQSSLLTEQFWAAHEKWI